jgi:hypothetical protein
MGFRSAVRFFCVILCQGNLAKMVASLMFGEDVSADRDQDEMQEMAGESKP